jgi:phosphate transport system substrate-binding protein
LIQVTSLRAFARARRIVLLIAAALVQQTAWSEEIKLGGTGAALGTMKLLADRYAQSQRDFKVTILPSLGSGGGIKAVMSGAIHIAVSTRDVTDAERSAGAVSTEYGRTPFVLATSVKSKIAGLTLDELINVYTGNSDRWPDGTKIRLVLRPSTDSDSEVLSALSPRMREAMVLAAQRPGMQVAVTDQEAADSIERIAGAIGTTTLALILSEQRQMKALQFNGADPTPEAIAKGRYPLYKSLYIVTAAKSSPSAQDFVRFVNSPTGRDILQRTGHWVR